MKEFKYVVTDAEGIHRKTSRTACEKSRRIYIFRNNCKR